VRELTELLERIAVVTADQVVFVGDLVARGPDTPGVLRLARELNAQAVRGNHEHRLLLAHAARKSGERLPRLGSSHAALLKELKEEDWGYLESMPLSLEFSEHNVRAVHAGVVPGVPFLEQQAWTLMHIRSLTGHGAPSDRFSQNSWTEHYTESPHIVFGHNAQAGLQLASHATGLDTACVYGGSLSALVLEAGQLPPPSSERAQAIVSVRSHDRYVNYGPRAE